MKIEEQVLSIEQMNHLKEVGLKVEDTALSWADLSEPGKFSVSPNYENAREILRKGCVIIPTLTLQEILELLPVHISVDGFENNFYFVHEHNAIDHFHKMFYWAYKHCTLWPSEIIKESELECAYAMLCWVLGNGYLNQ